MTNELSSNPTGGERSANDRWNRRDANAIDRDIESERSPTSLPETDVRAALASHAFSEGIEPTHLDLLASVGRMVEWKAGETVFRVGQPADSCYLLFSGRVAITVHQPAGDDMVVASLGPGSLLGWSWLYPPHRWHFDALATEHSRAIALDGPKLVRLFDEHPRTGLEFMRRFAHTAVQRLAATRLQLLDLYDTPRATPRGPATGSLT
ncbi:MAG: cyclic nucleotide-binding domain-containing protein [Acidimicrobiales bacterium]|nr:cyclic nucleotide-binding domain-containing protein [Acidimicrobiales bacterium]